MPIGHRTSLLVAVTFSACAMVPLAAQCQPIWQAGLDQPSLTGSVFATALWDPDGAGPLHDVLVVGGIVGRAGHPLDGGVVIYDLRTGAWSPLGSGLTNTAGETIVRCMTTTSAGLVVGGSFDRAGGVAANCVALWNGTIWAPLGSGLTGQVNALTVMANGNLLAGGDFTTVGGAGPGHLASWDGTQWTLFAGGANGSVEALLPTSGGQIVVGGAFTQVGTQPASSVATWTGSAWLAFASEPTGITHCLARAANGDLIIGGEYRAAPGLRSCMLARWNGSAWTAITIGLNGPVRALALTATGDLMVGGDFTDNNGVLMSHVAVWSGTTLLPIGPGCEAVTRSITVLPNGDVIAAGITGFGTSCIRRWDGGTWASLPPCNSGPVACSLRLRNGDLIVGGVFSEIQGVQANHVALWDGVRWQPMGSGVDFTPWALHELPNGNIVAGGSGTTDTGIHVWDGTYWTPLPQDPLSTVAGITSLANGDIVAVGPTASSPIVVLGNGLWQPLGPAPRPVGTAMAVRQLRNGDVLVVGAFVEGGSTHIAARFNGTSWSIFGAVGYSPFLGTSGYTALETRDGSLLFGGQFRVQAWNLDAAVARWDAGSQSLISIATGAVGSTYVTDLLELDNGDILAAGQLNPFAGSSLPHIARWDGSTWSAFAGGADAPVSTLNLAHGAIVAGGSFRSVGGAISAYVATLTVPCPAAATPRGNGCNGSTGPIGLRADILPWLGGECRATATGIAPNALALAIVGTQALQQPLSLAHPAAGAACLQLTSADALVTFAPANAGNATFAIRVPRIASLAGITFHEQVVQVEANAAGTIVALSSTNALALTIGVL